MRAVVFPGDGSIEIAARPSPTPGPGEVLVRVHGAGLNRADLVQQAGFYPAPPGVPADIGGLEFSGEVTATGDGIDGLRPGDRVFGIVGGGAQAEELVVPESCCVIVPPHLDLVEAGGVPEVFITAHDAMRTRAGLQPGDHVLVHAVGSGVGTAVVQLAKALGNTVTGTARTADKLERAAALGLDHGVLAPDPFDAPTLGQAVLDAGGHADVVIELVGGGYLDVDLAVAAVQGRIVVVGTLAGGNVEVPLMTLMSKRLALHGTVLRARSIEQKAAATAAFAAEVLPLLHDRKLQPVVDRVFPLDAAAEAYALMASNTTFGKVILSPV
jgi:NADPH:quinone reductase